MLSKSLQTTKNRVCKQAQVRKIQKNKQNIVICLKLDLKQIIEQQEDIKINKTIIETQKYKFQDIVLLIKYHSLSLSHKPIIYAILQILYQLNGVKGVLLSFCCTSYDMQSKIYWNYVELKQQLNFDDNRYQGFAKEMEAACQYYSDPIFVVSIETAKMELQKLKKQNKYQGKIDWKAHAKEMAKIDQEYRKNYVIPRYQDIFKN